MQPELKVYVGYDTREDIAWQVSRHSMLRHATRPVAVHPLRQASLRELGLYTRPYDAKASTEFSLTRFLTPYLAATSGWSLFLDCDTLFTADITAVLDGLDPAKAAYCVQHEYVPRAKVKMDGKAQHIYPRKNWSSFILFNGAHPAVRALTPDVVNGMPPVDLHRFNWIPDDGLIGALPPIWNFLEGDLDPPADVPNVIHFTNGGPWFENCQDVDYADLWLRERDLLLRSAGAGSAEPAHARRAPAPALSPVG